MPRALALAAAALVALPAVAVAGPPWVSIELPANPLDRTTRGAYLLVHSFHHERVITMSLTGRAEGMVNGKRTSLPLAFRETSRGAVFALDQSWPKGQAWVLVITAGAVNGKGGATALVGIGPDGEVRSVRVPNRKDGEFLVPTDPTAQEIERSLKTLAGMDGDDDGVSLALLPLVLLPFGVVALRRR
ncbi:MAG TPA: hypothetical protein VJ773_02105 [Gemmatimonadales bacterium]|nr:hypothetical protein [Gemmatimonadales bacterium]